jgi:carboxyl-terminal processing protease
VLLNEFTENAALGVKSVVNDLIKNHHIESLVLDLRNNGGGLVD